MSFISEQSSSLFKYIHNHHNDSVVCLGFIGKELNVCICVSGFIGCAVDERQLTLPKTSHVKTVCYNGRICTTMFDRVILFLHNYSLLLKMLFVIIILDVSSRVMKHKFVIQKVP